MSSKIRVLDEETINKIAAGEVIENPSSVVKELVENSLDAGSTEITVEIRGGGRQLIRITDNGWGMNRDDALLCLERHATSKLREIEEIYSVGTMGFRGEAIPSIASISKFTLYTRVNSPEAVDEAGTILMIDGGKIVNCAPVQCSPGTTIEVKSLFFNVPVRKKFQKSPAFDVAEIQRVLTQLALGNPSIRFQLISDQETLFSVSSSLKGSNSDILGERIRHLLGEDFFNALVPLEGLQADCRLEGFIGAPSRSRHNRLGQHLFINRRGVLVPTVSYAVRDGYGTMLATGRHPIYVLHLSMPMELLDVNVHPQKREVRLRHERVLKDLIMLSVESSLQKGNFSTSLPFSNFPEPAEFVSTNKSYDKLHSSFDRSKGTTDLPPWFSQPVDLFSVPGESNELPKERPYRIPALNICAETKADFKRYNSPEPTPHPQFLSSKPVQDSENLKQLKLLTILQNFLVATNGEGLPSELYLVDQRAAHARIIYEKILSPTTEPQELQMLLIPHLIELSAAEAVVLRGELPTLQAMGIQIKEFGPSSFAVDALPHIFGNIDIQKLIDEIVKNGYEKGDSTTLDKERKKKLAQAASHAAIASKTRLEPTEAQKLLDQLMGCSYPKQCPFGKATFVILAPNEIKKLFHS
ncbi:MAG: DNA mismatch repair endonuclease MutL [Parachlamydiaceae bacterium]|nr:DNA mismatch repair endonuclease MutL [Parachlamydiaceae bacterium]